MTHAAHPQDAGATAMMTAVVAVSATTHTATVDPAVMTVVTVAMDAVTATTMLHAALTATVDAMTAMVVVMTAVVATVTATTAATVVTVEETAEETAMVDVRPAMPAHQPPMANLLHVEMPGSHTEVDTTMTEMPVVPIER